MSISSVGRPRLFEPYAGTAAVSMRLAGCRHLAPYVGGKHFSSRQILEVLQLSSLEDVSGVKLGDAGPWGRFWEWCSTERLEAVADLLEGWDERYPQPEGGDRTLWEAIRSTRPPKNPVVWMASFLYLQARSYRGKPVWPLEDGWRTHGFDPEYRDTKVRTSAKTNNRGWANARPKIALRCRDLARVYDLSIFFGVRDQAMRWLGSVVPGDRVFLDPPYGRYQGYGPDAVAEPGAVESLALSCHARGALVVVAYDDPSLLPGAEVIPLTTRRSGRLQDGNAPLGDVLLVLRPD